MKIVWSRQAEADLEDVHTYIAHDNPGAATRVENRILDAIETLARYPHSGRVGQRQRTREAVVRGLPYVVIYEARDGELEIVRIWHSSRGTDD